MRSAVSFIVLVFLSLSFQKLHAEEIQSTLQEFETDGCTMFVEGTTSQPDLWAHCCFEHDLRYWFGGTKADKKFADVALRECVRDVAGSFWANLMYSGVKAGGYSPIKFKYVWSWGWQPKRDRVPLSSEEITYVTERIYALDLNPEFRDMFIKKYITKN